MNNIVKCSAADNKGCVGYKDGECHSIENCMYKEDMTSTDKEKIDKILELLYNYGQCDGSYHKAWCIDQVLRIIEEDNYESWVHNYEYVDDNGVEHEEQEYEWDCGIAP